MRAWPSSVVGVFWESCPVWRYSCSVYGNHGVLSNPTLEGSLARVRSPRALNAFVITQLARPRLSDSSRISRFLGVIPIPAV